MFDDDYLGGQVVMLALRGGCQVVFGLAATDHSPRSLTIPGQRRCLPEFHALHARVLLRRSGCLSTSGLQVLLTTASVVADASGCTSVRRRASESAVVYDTMTSPLLRAFGCGVDAADDTPAARV